MGTRQEQLCSAIENAMRIAKYKTATISVVGTPDGN